LESKGKRPGSVFYIEPWHKNIFDDLSMKIQAWVPDNFMRAVEDNGDWYLFCPNDIKVSGLKPFYEIYGAEYEEEYNKAVELGIGT
jgi:ribonucleotide reductase alpha subunit